MAVRDSRGELDSASSALPGGDLDATGRQSRGRQPPLPALLHQISEEFRRLEVQNKALRRQLANASGPSMRSFHECDDDKDKVLFPSAPGSPVVAQRLPRLEEAPQSGRHIEATKSRKLANDLREELHRTQQQALTRAFYGKNRKTSCWHFTPEELQERLQDDGDLPCASIEEIKRVMTHFDLDKQERLGIRACVDLALKDPKALMEQVGTDLNDTAQAIRGLIQRETQRAMVSKFTYPSTVWQWIRGKDSSGISRMETVMGIIIILNAALIGASTDLSINWVGWHIIDVVFAAIFVMELFFNIKQVGLRDFYKGKSWPWNVFDTFIVVLAVADSVMLVAGAELQSSLVTLIRVVRVSRFARLARVVRMPFFKDLSTMLSGLMAGAPTLLWSVVLLFLLAYMLAVVLTQAVGHQSVKDDIPHLVADGSQMRKTLDDFEKHRNTYFGNVPRSMFTVMRCIFADCGTVEGVPLSVVMGEIYGTFFKFTWGVCSVLITLGLFNIIVSIFVERTSKASKFSDMEQRTLRKREYSRVMQKSRELVRRIWEFCLTQNLLNEKCDASLSSMKISRRIFHEVLEDEMVDALLDDLGVLPEDRMDLFDILDLNGDGELDIPEVVDGLMRLRGEARKADIVAVQLRLMSLHDVVRKIGSQILQDEDLILRCMNGGHSLSLASETLGGSDWRSPFPSPLRHDAKDFFTCVRSTTSAAEASADEPSGSRITHFASSRSQKSSIVERQIPRLSVMSEEGSVMAEDGAENLPQSNRISKPAMKMVI